MLAASTIHISSAARQWAVKELARRAGITQAVFQSWKIEVSLTCTTVYLQPGTSKRIEFRSSFSPSFSNEVLGPGSDIIHAQWMRPPGQPIQSLIPDFIVPYFESREQGAHPLFREKSSEDIECFADLPALTVLMLARAEEVTPSRVDVHGRFCAEDSIAFRNGFLDRPIVDEWGLALAEAIQQLVPQWRPKPRRLCAKISHDIDEAGRLPQLWPTTPSSRAFWQPRSLWMLLPFDVRYAIRSTLRKSGTVAGVGQLGKPFSLRQTSCLDLISRAVEPAVKRGLDTAVYWKASRLGPYDSGYDPRNAYVRNTIRSLQQLDVENGVHPGYATYRCAEELQREVDVVRSVLGEDHIGGRQHYLRWCPETWIDWERAGLAYDSTLGYPEQVGFRAGTCIPYRPWLLSLDREANLLEIPLIVMDVTLLESLRLEEDQLLVSVQRLVEKCAATGGVFTLLFHNTTLRNESLMPLYNKILDILDSSSRFDWKSSLRDGWD
jgi:hypothetical protein